MDPSHRIAPYGWCLLAAALFGASTPAAKALVYGTAPLVVAGLLYAGAALAVLPFALRGGVGARRRDPANLRRLAGSVVFGGILGPAALLYGLALAPAASVSLWLNLETVATALIAVWWFRERLEGRAWVAVSLVVGAGVLLAAPEGFHLAPAAGLVALACLCWGLDNNFTAVIDGYTPAQVTLAKGVFAGTFDLVVALLAGGSLPSPAPLGAALLVGALGYGLSIVLYIRAAQHLGAARSQMVFATAPFLGVLGAWVGLGEPVLAVQIAAGPLFAAALALVYTTHHAHAHHHPGQTHTHLHRHDDGHHDHEHPGLPASAWHVHEHTHEALTHTHTHLPDLHHRHDHADSAGDRPVGGTGSGG